jgi:hypothetical protein
MKKQLIGTTALVGVGALAAPGLMQDANAAEPLSLSIGGYFQTSLEYQDNDDSTGEPGDDKQDTGIFDDGEIQFTASTTLDNGIGVKARIEYEADNQGDGETTVDEHYVEFSGGFGQLRVGADDNASNAMHYQAPVASGNIGVNTPTFAVALAGGNAIGSYPSTYVNLQGDAQKIIWFSPRIAGFQLGLSYAPDGDTNQNNSKIGDDDDPGQQDQVFSVGINFVETFNDIDVAVSAGYLQGDLEGDPTNFNTIAGAVTSGGNAIGTVTTTTNGDDAEQWSAGLNVGFAGFTVGASIKVANGGFSSGVNNNGDQTIWDAGVTYATGPLTVGFTYLHADAEDPGGGGNDEADQALVSASYNIGPGVDLFGGVKVFQYEDGAGDPADENEGFIVSVGSSVSF